MAGRRASAAKRGEARRWQEAGGQREIGRSSPCWEGREREPTGARGLLGGASGGGRAGSSAREAEPSQAGGRQCPREAGGVANAWSPT